MVSTYSKNKGSKSTGNKVIEIPQDIIKQLEALPPRKRAGKEVIFTDWEDNVIKTYMPKRTSEQIGKIINKTSYSVRRRYKRLIGE